MKSLILLCLASLLLMPAGAQTFRFHNLMNADARSNIIYAGIENLLLIAPAGQASGVQYTDGEASLRQDTLFIKPLQPGPATVILFHAGGREELLLRAMAVPAPVLLLEGHTPGSIRLGRYQRGQKIMVEKTADGFWNDYMVERFAAAINNVAVVNEGALPGNELAEALRKSPRGSMLTITMVELRSTRTGRRETIRQAFRFVVE